MKKIKSLIFKILSYIPFIERSHWFRKLTSKYFLFFGVILFIFLAFAGESKALTIYQCNSIYCSPYTSKFSSWNYYDINNTGNISCQYVLQNCFSVAGVDGIVGLLCKGQLGNAVCNSHLLVEACEDGTCESTETENFENATQGDLYFTAIYEVKAYDNERNEKFFKFFTDKDSQPEAPDDKWSMMYFYYGSGSYTPINDPNYFGATEDANLIITYINGFGELVRNQPPMSYFVDIYDAWNFGEIATDSTKNLSLDFGNLGLGQAELEFNQPDIGIKQNFQGLFNFGCYIATGLAVFFMIRNFVRPGS